MRYYSELYSIGILAILVSNQTFADLRNSKLHAPLKPNDVFVQELYSAPFMAVQAPAKKKFLEEGLGLRQYQDVCRWGEPLEQS
jgi:hypothetical protein